MGSDPPPSPTDRPDNAPREDEAPNTDSAVRDSVRPEAPSAPPSSKPDSTPAWLPDLFDAAQSFTAAHKEPEFFNTLRHYSNQDIFAASQHLIDSPQPDLQRCGLKMLGSITPSSQQGALATSVLLNTIALLSPPLTAAAILSLSRLAPEPLLDLAPKLMEHRASEVRKAFAIACGHIGTPDALDCLLTLSDDDAPSVCAWSMLGCHNAGPQDDPELQEALEHHLSEETHSPHALLQSLATARDPSLAAYLLEALEQPTVLPHIIQAAGTLADKSLYVPLWNLAWTWTGSPALIDHALSACRWEDPRSVRALFQDALSEDDLALSEEAIGLLQRRGDQEVFDTAEALTQNPDHHQRLVGARVLGKTGGPRSPFRQRAVTPLARMLEDRDDDILASAVEGIGAIKEAELSEAVEGLQSHDNPDVRKAVSRILYGMEPEATTSMIALRTAREGMVRAAASQALDEILNPSLPPGEEASPADVSGSSSGASSGATPLRDHRYGAPSAAGQQGAKRRSALQNSPLLRKAVLFNLLLGVALTIYWAGTLQTTTTLAENPKLIRALLQQNFSALERPDPDALLQQQKQSRQGMFETNRLLKLSSMLRLPIEHVLTNRKECWYLYNRMFSQDAAWVLSRARAPKGPDSVEAQTLAPLLSILTKEVNGDNHTRVAHLLRHLAPLNAPLTTYLIKALFAQTSVRQHDDLVMDFATIAPELKEALHKEGYQINYHPSLTHLPQKTQAAMEKHLRAGWTNAEEAKLANYLRQLQRENAPTP
ncbi:MAG: HEAT repeat domain-containing protein [Myxococcota bacterium]|nr:HEAT repeat domain-containing protein [Myxococcota bacterium]